METHPGFVAITPDGTHVYVTNSVSNDVSVIHRPGNTVVNPLLIALLKKIPPSETPWPAAQRIRWFRTFAMNVSQIYDVDSEPVEMEIKVTDTKE